MTRDELIEFIAKKANLNIETATAAVDAIVLEEVSRMKEKYANLSDKERIEAIDEEIRAIDEQINEIDSDESK